MITEPTTPTSSYSDNSMDAGEGDAGAESDIPELDLLALKAGEVFSPSAPIDQRKLFAGRLEQLSALMDAIATKGQHAVVYGERGVGKTSLVSIAGMLRLPGSTPFVTYRQNCHHDDTFSRLWRRAFESVQFEVQRSRIGFSPEITREVHSLADGIPKDPTPDTIVNMLRKVNAKVVFIFDEFDQVVDKSVAQSFAEVIKALSDFSVQTKVVVVGVGDTVDALIASHASIERAIKQIRMPRMQQNELVEIIVKATQELGVTCDEDATLRIVRISQGLPHYVHSIGLQAVRQALYRNRKNVVMTDVDNGITEALTHASQSLVDSYVKACSSPQKDSIYKQVLLACALAKTDELSCFTPASVRVPLKEMGRPLEIPAFAAHLNKFAAQDRGAVLQKIGSSRRFRYRFMNPLLQPYVVMRGISERLISVEQVDALLGITRP